MEFQIRPTDTADFSRLTDMFALCLGRRVDDSYFRWKYLENPSGPVVAFEAFEQDNIAAFYGVIPECYADGQEKFLAYQSMDTMTHPNYQKKGLFVKLAKHTYAAVQAKHPELLIVGVPGSNSFHGFVNKLDWKHLIDIPYIFTHRAAFTARNIFRRDRTVQITELSSFTEDIQGFLDRFYATQKMIRPVYDVATLNWKVFRHPFKTFKVLSLKRDSRIEGLMIYSKENNRIKIELADFSHSESSDILLREGLSRIFEDNPQAQWLFTWEPTRKDLKTAYRKAGLLKNPFSKGPFSYKVPFIIYGTKFAGADTEDLRSRFDLQPLIQD
ncbi:MAG: GNAT family N-acetyltransferase [Chitinophagaceae bacterium]